MTRLPSFFGRVPAPLVFLRDNLLTWLEYRKDWLKTMRERINDPGRVEEVLDDIHDADTVFGAAKVASVADLVDSCQAAASLSKNADVVDQGEIDEAEADIKGIEELLGLIENAMTLDGSIEPVRVFLVEEIKEARAEQARIEALPSIPFIQKKMDELRSREQQRQRAYGHIELLELILRMIEACAIKS